MIKEKYKISLKIPYFLDLFKKRKRKYPKSYFFYPLDTRKHTVPLHDNLFKKTINTYFDIYFKELYHHDIPKYFPLSGLIKKTKGKHFYSNPKRGIVNKSRGITWLWYLRPCISYFSNMKIMKLNGSTSRVLKLDNNYKLNRDVELLPSVRNEMKLVLLFKE